jgi:hypothetical protein
VKKLLSTSLAMCVVLLAAQASAQIQTQGSQVFPGKLMIGFHPLGASVDFRGDGGRYKFAADIAGRLATAGPLGIYLGGGLNYGVSPRATFTNHDVQVWAFVMLTMERLIKFPIVPYVQAGFGTDIFLVDSAYAIGTFAIRLGAGAHYWITKNVGLGLETHFTFGPEFVAARGGLAAVTDGYGQFDFLVGARFAF